MLYQLHPSKEAGHMLKKREFSRRTFCLLRCSFSFLFLQQMSALEYTVYFSLISNVPATNSYTSSHTRRYHQGVFVDNV